MRITHWLIAVSIVVLSATGLYIGHPFITVSGPASQRFVMGWIKVIHGYTAYVFITAVIARLIWMFTGNRYAHWDKFIPVRSERRQGLWPTLKFYLFALRKPPGFVGHNPLAGATYTLVFGLYFVAIVTGLAHARRQRGRGLVRAMVRVRWRRCLVGCRSHDGFTTRDVAPPRIRRPSRLQQRADVDDRGQRHDGVDLLRLQVRAARGSRVLRVPIHQPARPGR